MTPLQRLTARGWPAPLLPVLGGAWLLVLASNLLGDSQPFIALGVAAWALSWTGSGAALPWLAIAASLWLPWRSASRLAHRGVQTLAIALAFTVFLGAGSALNEWVLKPALAVPRPSVVALAKAGALAEGAEAFYALPSATERRARLNAVLAAAGVTVGPADARVRGEWGAMIGYSFPSGHAFASMLFATLCAGLALLLRPPGWRVALWGLPLWAVAVCWSRPIIGVHTPIDVSVGSAQGLFFGLVGLWATRAALRRLGASFRDTEGRDERA
ncbi:MAG: phosphatase PAP2 family protein [Myxococcota bacterium]